DLAEQAYLSAGRLSQMALSSTTRGPDAYADWMVQTQMEELRTLGTLLMRLGEESRAIQAGGAERLTELHGALDRLASVAQVSATSSFPGVHGGSPGAAQQDMIRLATVFANDLATLARQAATVTHEMREGLATFRLEGGAPQGPALYAPGTGYAGRSSGY